jgi:hypothetical protein
MSEVFKVIASVVLLGIERQEPISKLFGYLKHELVDRYVRTHVRVYMRACSRGRGEDGGDHCETRFVSAL